MNDLDRAKELKEKWDNSDLGYDLETSNYQYEITTNAKKLKEKVEKGCGKKFYMAHDSIGEVICAGDICTCKDCKETLKILNEILGEKEWS